MCSPFLWLCCLFERFQRTKLSWQRRQVMDVFYLWFGNMNCRVFSVPVCLCSYNSLFWRPRKLNSWDVIFGLLFTYAISGMLLLYLLWDPELSEMKCIFFSCTILTCWWKEGYFAHCQLQFRFLECCFVALLLFWFHVIITGLFLNYFLIKKY